MAIKGSQGWLGATDSGLRLGSYPLGCAQSRAAARALLNSRRAVQGDGTLFRLSVIGRPHDPGRKCTCRTPEAGTFALCKCFYNERTLALIARSVAI